MSAETGETGKAGIIVAAEDAHPMEKLVSRARLACRSTPR
jgi:hypothetical protein